MHDRAIIRRCLAGALFLIVCSVQAQTDLVLKLDHKADEGQEKLVYEALFGLDPALSLTYEPSGPEFHLISNTGLSPAQYIGPVERIMQDNVVSVYDLTAQRTEEAQVPLSGFPKYIRTGDNSKDDPDYQQRKERWIKEHKEAYDLYQARQRSITE